MWLHAQQIVASDDPHPEVQSCSGNSCAQRIRTSCRIYSASIGNQLHAPFGNLGKVTLKHADKVGCIAERRILGPGPSEDRHSHLGQIIERDVVQSIVLQQLRKGDRAVAPKTRRSAYADHPAAHV